MFTCLWNLWDWLDPSMENKKTAQTNEPLNNNAVPKHSHQHNAPQGRLLQYPLLSQPHQHQPQNVQQKFLNNQLHQYVPYNPSQPSNRPLYNPLNQHNPQIWVPHQPPVHYHNQQLKNETNQPRQTPVHQKPKEPERKKSNQQLRSPIAKRPPQAPVTMQGWLHKQGSEGLMLWKKRWFVLSEYCLFYYKGSEEEKLLGSILLPSYKVSVCGPQDKINKKFAFKCEHSNMRTYILAADSHESMVKWVQLLNSACLLQSQCDVMPQPAQAEPAVPVHQYHQMPLNRIIPIHTHSSSNTTDLSSPSQQELMQYTQQPLYANAPPKPRRINSSYSSPSPEVSERYMRDIRALQYVPQHPDVYSRKHPQIPKYHIREPPVYLSHNSERRTPDTYGRSKLATKVHYPGDYEDVYAEQAYKRPVSPLAYSNNTRRLSPMVSAMQPARVPSMTGPVSVNRPAAIITRPHSADFLEYEVSRVADVRPQQPRPKSSLDINRNTQNNDSYFYSEQRYAENMRKSAQYLPHMPKFAAGAQNGRVTMPNTPPIKLENLSITEPNRSRSVLSEGSLSKELEADMRGYYDVNNSVTMTPQRQFEMRRPEYDQFMRSASARLAYSDRGSEVKSISREGERKREESMKRLLEWKQRMLQSPLNRKVSQSVTSRGNQDYFDRIHVNPEQKSGISLSQYNSYSSDDEEKEDRSKEKPQTQAGWTSDMFPTVSETRTLAPASPITAFNSPTVTNTPTLEVDDTFTEPLKVLGKEPSHLAQISSLRSEFSEKFQQSPAVTETKSNGALVKSILAEDLRENCKTPTNTTAVIEENYVTMTPKKSAPDENPYMEMTQSMEKFSQQPYESVYFSQGGVMLEPVYMELEQRKQAQLPDILQPSSQETAENSDSSDADDEASKDLDSLDTPNHPRFSLSDSFRPASYYLGASQIAHELQDSSDSELVSPPPIPNNDESINSNLSLEAQKKVDCESENGFGGYHDYENMYVKQENGSGRQSVLSHDDYVQRSHDNTASTTEITSLLQLSVCSTPSISVNQEISTFYFQQKQSAPYYYSDLSMNTSPTNILTLNNQRTASNGNKRDITHIVNPIRCAPYNNFKLAVEARSVSVDFLNLADKSGQIDKKNIYESDTLKRLKGMDSISSLQSNPETRNLFPSGNVEKFIASGESNVRRSHSLEGLLENVLSESAQSKQEQCVNSVVTEGSYLWEEDSVWQQRLRSASQRHTKSLDDLDCVCEPKQKKRGITRVVTYVNDMPVKWQEEPKKAENCKHKNKEQSFIIDREKLRQWDLMSSAPSDGQLSRINNAVVEAGVRESSEPEKRQDQASGSMSLNLREAYPRNWGPNPQHLQSRSNSHEFHDKSLRKPLGHYSQHELDANKRANNQWTSGMNVSAGELLGRTHEELVLLLIQLRRQSTNTCHAIEACYNEIDSIQAQMHLMGQAKRMESLQKLEQIKQHLVELEKQYEKGKPLVNLVDNMVKLGSLYRSPTDRYNPYIRDKLEFNQNIQERRLLTEEKRDWNRLNSNHSQLQEKVHELYQLDRLIQEESGTLHSLQQDKEDIERALGDLRHRINQGLNDPAEIEQAMKQQMALENELSRVHSMLAENSKKLEETVAGNARLEQKLLVLKQKLQISRQQRNSPQFSNPGDSLPCFVGTSAMLESDLQKVQQKVGDLQRQRHELSTQVRHLTDRSSNLQQDVKLSNTLGSKRKVQSVWRETDLDTMNIVDHGETSVNSPLYINTDLKQSSESDVYNYGMKSSDSTSDDTTQNSSNLCHVEKQEIKTVRIVKRESERRHRDREKSAPGKWELVPEEDDSSQFCTASVYSDSRLTSSTDESKSSELSPVFKSEAARQIITEMSVQETPKLVNRRLVPKEKRRHYTAPHNNLIMKSLNQLPTADNSTILLNEKRARDDLDMERALRQRIDAPDVVRSTLSNKELKYNENTIDTILGTPNKISIPERYIPEQLPQLSAEEQEHRLRKVESIKKMLSDTIIASGNPPGFDDKEKAPNLLSNKATSKMIEEKKQREHLLQLNQILAKQVMEMSKIVAVKALAALPLQEQQVSTEDEDLSPVTPLPLYQQRDNFYS